MTAPAVDLLALASRHKSECNIALLNAGLMQASPTADARAETARLACRLAQRDIELLCGIACAVADEGNTSNNPGS